MGCVCDTDRFRAMKGRTAMNRKNRDKCTRLSCNEYVFP